MIKYLILAHAYDQLCELLAESPTAGYERAFPSWFCGQE
jgi:hypothetical protein